MDSIHKALTSAINKLFEVDPEIELTRPDEKFGDFATNIALKISGVVGSKPLDVAEKIKDYLLKNNPDLCSEITVAGPGFLNFKLSDKHLWESAQASLKQPLKGQTIVTEYSDPNPFKILHAGHLYTSIVGASIANLLELAGAKVSRVNFGGDVGLHVGKTMWAMLKNMEGEYPEKLDMVPEDERSEWMASAYVEGSRAYEDDDNAKAEIIELNKKIYQIHSGNDKKSPLAQIYWTTRDWSYQYFKDFYKTIGISFDKFYPESETIEIGVSTVKKHLGNVFTESDGAIIFDGEKHGLHTRVFINSEGLPTYEAKDIGLVMLKKRDYNFDQSVIITGKEQQQYMQVVLKAIEQFEPDLAKSTRHLTHGIVKLSGGEKMSSRKGNFLRAVDVLDKANEANKKNSGKEDFSVALSAVKYSFLRHRIGGDIIYDPDESVNILGNSGPYLQYSYARAHSIMRKSKTKPSITDHEFTEPERSLVRKLSEFVDVVAEATDQLMPHIICNYLYELCQQFNSFYEHSRVIGDEREQLRLKIIDRYATTLKNGLEILNIPAQEKM